VIDEDIQFFTLHSDRQARIRLPRKTIAIDKKTHRTAVGDECEQEFLSLGPHNKDRRRMLVWRVPSGHPLYDHKRVMILPIPFLLFADETVEDRDDILLPIVHEVMSNARFEQGV